MMFLTRYKSKSMICDMLNNKDDCQLDHIAIAVDSLKNSQKIFTDLGLTFEKEQEVVESQNVTTSFANLNRNARLELLYPHDKSGVIQKFLDKNGPGIHHICLRVSDIVSKCSTLKNKGYNLIYSEPTKGADNCLVNFIHPKSTGGILIELSQKVS